MNHSFTIPLTPPPSPITIDEIHNTFPSYNTFPVFDRNAFEADQLRVITNLDLLNIPVFDQPGMPLE